jgi:2-oxoglutarate dehydrogenase E2 component (dihydrolipoamide succinyltransferase)
LDFEFRILVLDSRGLAMPTNVVMPQMGESVAEGTITKWLKRVGDRVQQDEPLFEITTDKVDADIPSPAAGILSQILVHENETVAVNSVVAQIVAEEEAAAVELVPTGEAAAAGTSPPPEEGAPAPSPVPKAPQVPGMIRSSPLVRRIARDHGVDLSRVKGTGVGGRVTKEDVLSYVAQSGAGAPRAAAPPAPGAPPPIIFTGPTHVVPMTPMRRQIAERMVASRRTSAHAVTLFEVEMTKVVELMARRAEEFERRHGVKLTYTPFFVRAAVKALKQFPIINASVEGTNIVYKRDINIGIAVALETGLIVPVIKQADEKNFLEIARAVQDFADRARSKRLSVDEVQGGTFTITNPGVFGSLLGTPIIHQPQLAVLCVGAIEKRPVVREDAIAIRPMVYLTLSFDHRVIDGSVADQFMRQVKLALESWEEAVV